MYQAQPSYDASLAPDSNTPLALLTGLLPNNPTDMVEVQSRLEWLNSVLDIAQIGFWAWDFCTGRIYSTPLCETIMGFESKPLAQTFQDWMQRIHPEDVPVVESAIQAAVAGPEDCVCQCRIVYPNSTLRWVECRGRSFRDSNQQPRKMLGTIADITDRKQAELAFWDYTEELAQVNQLLTQATTLLKKRNDELDQFAYIVSHDLKAPLRAISNLSEWIEEDMDTLLPAENREQLHLLRQRVYRMEGLINGLLEYSRIGRIATEVEQVVVQDLLQEVVDSLSPPPELPVEIGPEMPVFQARRLPLLQVFSNLISNAIKYHGSTCGKIQISVRDLGSEYEFAVADDGPGIAPEHHDRIFGIFQTLQSRDKQESTGIGLAIVKRILEGEGGKIWLKSELGQGATFYFTWPKHLENETHHLSDS